ncbi:hypothetical protein NXX39_20855 [Bacteroides ovatus]|jgi:hypothetical protein|uniref:hypothetical protein n=1 Tax=Bacteroides ovatus TaxID=28116 RepID=UPI00123145E3|nr:hypothetical protein [Bacteroides ovatus]DAS37587.1 MAG TPA: hypothetical protein [Caudoviricetes sp.]DAU74108.1 MAG TPA: hypothetical protein [Crassvirales sp.]KAA4671574.1 hypothetical protein F3B42_14115 [Bacteroides ovatus]KAA4680718.1 hypothetical protein F3B41_15405 [Bacteroides ovatus]MCS2475529.1 hypothetical protein [Bacteroides ovatus]
MKTYIVEYNPEQQTSDVLVEFVKDTQCGVYTQGESSQECKIEFHEDYQLDYSQVERENDGFLFLGLCY